MAPQPAQWATPAAQTPWNPSATTWAPLAESWRQNAGAFPPAVPAATPNPAPTTALVEAPKKPPAARTPPSSPPSGPDYATETGISWLLNCVVDIPLWAMGPPGRFFQGIAGRYVMGLMGMAFLGYAGLLVASDWLDWPWADQLLPWQIAGKWISLPSGMNPSRDGAG